MIDYVKSLFNVNKDTCSKVPLSRSVWIFSIIQRGATSWEGFVYEFREEDRDFIFD